MRLIILTGPIASALGGMAIAALVEGALGQLNPKFVLQEDDDEDEPGPPSPATPPPSPDATGFPGSLRLPAPA